MSWQVQWTERALKDMARLDTTTRHRLFVAVDRFAATGQGDIKRLQGAATELFRLRVGGWRVIFSRETNNVLSVQRVRPRGSAYQP